MNSCLLLLSIVGQPPKPAQSLTLDDVRKGLEGLTKALQTRHIKYVRSPFNIMPGAMTLTYPDRDEVETVVHADGKWFGTHRFYKGGVLQRESTSACDGSYTKRFGKSGGSPRIDGTVDGKKAANSGALTDDFDLPFAMGSTMTRPERFFYEILCDANARLVGPTTLAGRTLTRVTFESPSAADESDSILTTLDLDADRQFWPVRRIDKSVKKGVTYLDIHFTDFRQHDGFWVPTKKITLFGEKQERLEFLYTHFEVGNSKPLSTFQLEFSVGTRVYDRARNTSYVAGGSEGQRVVEKQLAERLASMPPVDPTSGTPVSAIGTETPYLWYGLGGVLLIGLVVGVRMLVSRR